MRVHRLEITAFGPFADTQTIDFDPLNEAGVFLLTGLTGAGKTSILDAVCFGLYGQVPGVRDKAKTYRSHHAAADLAPRVVLEVTLQGRRFRLTRHATWSRPSRRARSGFVDEKARASAEELVTGPNGQSWVVRSTRADEVGHLVSGLLGLNRDQFCQVVMLPQGEFQAFLRAGGRDRQHILESLFGTQRFQAVERWLVEHRRAQSRRYRDHEEELNRLVARISEVCSPRLAEQLPSTHPPVDYSDVLSAVERLTAEGRSALTEMSELAGLLLDRSKEAQHTLDQARALVDRQARHHEALRTHTSLMSMADLVAEREQRVRRARAAEPLVPLVNLVADAELTLSRATTARDQAGRQCTAAGGLPDLATATCEAVERVNAELVQRASRLTELLGLEVACDALHEEHSLAVAAQEDLAARITELDDQIYADPGLTAQLRTEVAGLAVTAGGTADAQKRLTHASQTLAGALEVQHLDECLAGLKERRLLCRECSVQASEAWLTARERYLSGLAAELAGTLVDASACPVCGSLTHPAPAVPGVEHVGREREAELLGTSIAAKEAVTELDGEITEVERARGEALARSGGRPVEWATAAAAAARTELTAANSAGAEHANRCHELEELIGAAETRRASRERLVAERAALAERVAGYEQRLHAKRARLTSEVGPDVRVSDVAGHVSAQVAACRALLAAVRAKDEAERAAVNARSRLSAGLETAIFDTADAVLAGALPATEIANAESLNRAHYDELAAVARVLGDPVLGAAAAEPVPDLTAVASYADTAAGAAANAGAALAEGQRREARLEQLLSELTVQVRELEPLRAAKDLADDVAGLCAGTSSDNLTRTALSHYVLAARLAQVVAAANRRLDSICGGRYQLSHTMTREAGDNRGGLGLVVSDTHTDRDRDPATLSGGETFYVSLSLALGLADVVSNEAGGAELSTLFVDEGFGALDDETRDEVLDELDALRSGGRTVGLVSHLSELRARFPVQLHVVAGQSGSQCLPTPSDDRRITTGLRSREADKKLHHRGRLEE